MSSGESLKGSFIWMILPILLVSFVSRIASNIYLPALPEITGSLSISAAEASGTVTIYFLVLSIASLLAGAISDYYNKKSLLMWGSLLTVVGSLLCAVASGLSFVMVGRAVQAVGGAIILVTSQTWLAGVGSKGNMLKIFAYFSLALSIAPLFAPTLGGFITEFFSWRYNFIFLIVITLLAMFAIRGNSSKEQFATLDKKDLSLKNSLKSYFKLIASRTFIPIIGSSLLCYMFQGSFMAYSSFLFIDEFGMDPSDFGIASIPIVAGLIIGRIPTVMIEQKRGIMAAYSFNTLIILLSLGASLLYYQATGSHSVWELLVVLTIFNIGFSGHVILSLRNGMMLFNKQKGQVSATINFLNQTVSYLASFAVQILFAREVTSMVTYNIFAVASLALMVVIFFAFRASYRRMGGE